MHKEDLYDLVTTYYTETLNETTWQSLLESFSNKTTKYDDARHFYVHMGSKIEDMLI